MRAEDWPSRLDRFIAERAAVPFEWAVNDCALFAADWVRLATGRDPAAAFRGRYSTALGAERALRRYGAGDLVSTWTALEGEPLPSPLMAQRGDVVAAETDYGPALGVCLGDRLAHVSPEGLCFLPLRAAEMAWRV